MRPLPSLVSPALLSFMSPANSLKVHLITASEEHRPQDRALRGTTHQQSPPKDRAIDHNSLCVSIQPIPYPPCEAEVLEGPQLGLTLSSLLQSESDSDWALLGTSTTPCILGLWQLVSVSLITALGTSWSYKTTPGFRGREELHMCSRNTPRHQWVPLNTSGTFRHCTNSSTGGGFGKVICISCAVFILH